VTKRDPNQQAARQVEKITGCEPVRGKDLVSWEACASLARERVGSDQRLTSLEHAPIPTSGPIIPSMTRAAVSSA